VALWGRFLLNNLIAVQGGTDLVAGYASRDDASRKLAVWVVNRGYEEADAVTLALPSSVEFSEAKLFQLAGTGPDDADPRWRELGEVKVKGNSVKIPRCPGVSITVIALESE
jgi:hypothetical protein